MFLRFVFWLVSVALSADFVFSQSGPTKAVGNSEMFRVWTESGDKSRTIRARIAKVNPTTVVLEKESDGSEVVVRKAKLSKLDVIYADVASLVDADRAQYDEVAKVLSELKAGSYPKPEQIEPIYKKYPKSPYGFMLMGITTINADPDYEKSVPYLVKALKAVEERHALVTNLMPVTHMSCCINHAAAQWRVGASAIAVKSLMNAAVYKEIPAVILHNAKVIEREDPHRSEKFHLSPRARDALSSVLSITVVPPHNLLHESAMHFSLNIDPPPDADKLEAMIQEHIDLGKNANTSFTNSPQYREMISSQNCPYEPWCLSCAGRGAMRCEGRCNRGIVSEAIRTVEAYNQITRQPIYGTRYVDKACPVCKGNGVGDVCRACQGRGRK